MKKLILLSVATLTTSAMSYQCEVDLIDLRTNAVIDTFYAQEDGAGNCREGLKQCSLELRKRGYDRNSAMCSTQPVDPGPGQGPGNGQNNPRHWDRIIDQLEDDANSQNASLRVAAIRQLEGYPTTRSLDIAISKLSDYDLNVRNQAFYTADHLIATIDLRNEILEIKDLVIKKKRSSSAAVRVKTLSLVAATASITADLLTIVLDQTSDYDLNVRNKAQEAIIKLLQAPDINYVANREEAVLINFSSDSTGAVIRINSMKALGSSDNLGALKAVIVRLGDYDLNVRNAAAQIGDQMVRNPMLIAKLNRNIESIATLMSNRNPTVRVRTLRYLALTRNLEIRSYVSRAYNDYDLNVRNEADRIYKEMARW